MQDFPGPHFTADLIGPNGKLARLHKGGPPAPAPPPPPVRESNRQVASEGESARAAALQKQGYLSTINPKKPQSLLGNYDQPGTRSLL